MNISIIGSGYVGLVTGVCFANKGHKVTCYDKDEKIVRSLNKCTSTFYEPGLDKALSDAIKSNNFKAKNISELLGSNSKIIMIAVGTPSKNGDINLEYIQSALKLVANYVKSVDYYVSVIIKSTVIPGTTDTFVKNILEKYSGKALGQFGLGMNPEFLREGSALEDAENPDRIVIGYCDNKTKECLRSIYKPWDTLKIEVNTRTAEMIKYANNSLLATQISVVNEIANITQQIGNIDVSDVMEGVLADKRWSVKLKNSKTIHPDITNYLIPGCGFGGSCFPKDVEALTKLGKKVGVQPRILKAVLDVNEEQPNQILKILKQKLPNIKNRKILVLGLSFKPGTDDIRDSVSIKVIKSLLNEEVFIYAHDPKAIKNAKKVLGNNSNVQFIENWEKDIQHIDIVLILTNWAQYKPLKNHSKALEEKIIFDARRFFTFKDFPFSTYLSIGRSFN